MTVLERALLDLLNASVAGSEKDKFRAQQKARDALDATQAFRAEVGEIQEEVGRLEVIAHLPNWPKSDAHEFRECLNRINFKLEHLPGG